MTLFLCRSILRFLRSSTSTKNLRLAMERSAIPERSEALLDRIQEEFLDGLRIGSGSASFQRSRHELGLTVFGLKNEEYPSRPVLEQGHQVVGNPLGLPDIAPLEARKSDPAVIGHFEPVVDATVFVSCGLRDGHEANPSFLRGRIWLGRMSDADVFYLRPDGTLFYLWRSYGINDRIHDCYEFSVIKDAEFTGALMHSNSPAGALKHFRFAQCAAGIGCDGTSQRLEERIADTE